MDAELIIYLIGAIFILSYSLYVLFKKECRGYNLTISETFRRIRNRKESQPLNIRPKFLRELLKNKNKADYLYLEDLIYDFFDLDVFPYDFPFDGKENVDLYTRLDRREINIKYLAGNYTFFLENADDEEVNIVCNETIPMIIRLRKEIDLKPELPASDKEKYNKRLYKICRILEKEINENYENIASSVYKVDEELLKEADELINDRM